MKTTSQPGLIRGIRRWDLVAIALNGIIGAGIFGMPSKVYSLSGPYSLLAFVACAVVVALIVLCFAEISSRFTDTGGPYLYARETFGSLAGFEVGWLMWVARVTAFAANLNLMVDYAAYFWTGIPLGWTRVSVITFVAVTMTIINVVGVRNAATFSDIFTVAKLIPMVLFIMTGLFFLNPESFSGAPQPSISAFSQSVLLLVYAFTGFEIALIPAGEVRDPQRSMPFALLTSLALVALIYIGIQAVCIGTLPTLATSPRPIADAASHFLGALGGSVITAGVIVSILGNLSVLLLAAARLPFAMAGNRELPQTLGAVHARYHTPYIAIVATGAVMLALALSGGFIYAATISTIARLLAYIAACVGMLILRRRYSEEPLFKAPAGAAVSFTALLLIIWLLAHSTGKEARAAAIGTVAGLLIYGTYKLLKPRSKVEASADYTLEAKEP